MSTNCSRLAALALGGALVLSACSSGSGGHAATAGDILRVPFSFSMQVPDPDIFFQAEGLNVTTAVYEGLLRQKPNATKADFQPWLATSYSVSKNGKDYTFHLRHGVTFHDGSPMDAEAVKFSFDRRKNVNAGPAESLYAYKSAQVVDKYTVVIHLTRPSTEFIPFLASAYGQKIVSPTIVRAHEVNGDLGQKWLATHDAGTGPYTISSFTSQKYDLTAYPNYWGTKAGFPHVEITVDPDFTSQTLQLKSGRYNVLTHGVPTADLADLKKAGYSVTTEPTLNLTSLFLNPSVPAFATAAGRNAIAGALDRAAIVQQVFGSYATVADQMLPSGILPSGTATYPVTQDVSAAQAYVRSLPAGDRKVDFAYLSDDPDNQQIAQLVAAQLQQVGLQVTVRSVTQEASFGYPSSTKNRPDMLLVDGMSSDAAAPDPYARLFYYHEGGLSYFQPTQASDADRLLDQARSIGNEAQATQAFEKAYDAYARSGLFIPMDDRPEVFVTAPGITGIEHQLNAISTLQLASLRPEQPNG